MLELLLEPGANPNQLWHGHTPWQRLLTLVHELDWVNIVLGMNSCDSSFLDDVLMNWVGVFRLLLRYGASINTTCMRNHSKDHLVSSTRDVVFSHNVLDVIMDVFFYQLPEDALNLQHMVNEMGKSAAARNLNSLGGKRSLPEAELESLTKRPRC